jgi:hypothetical protein
MKKLPVSELLRLACIYAERDQQEFAHSIASCDDMEVEQEKVADFVTQLREYRLKRWGRTKLEQEMEAMVPVTIAELAKRTVEAP